MLFLIFFITITSELDEQRSQKVVTVKSIESDRLLFVLFYKIYIITNEKIVSNIKKNFPLLNKSFFKGKFIVLVPNHYCL